jgi:hypothetical protein
VVSNGAAQLWYVIDGRCAAQGRAAAVLKLTMSGRPASAGRAEHMTTNFTAPDSDRVPLIMRRVKFSEYLWFAALLLVMVTARILETQAP